MKNFKKWLAVTGLITGLVVLSTPAFANQFNFSVKANLPENQISKASYFDLLMKPGQKQTVMVELSNGTDKEVIVEQDLAPATTNINGVVEYSPNKIKADSSLKYNLKDYVTADKEIVLAPKTAKKIKVQIDMPTGSFTGYMAGGLTYKEKSDSKKASKSKGISIQNEYAYVIALLLSQSKDKVAPDLKMKNIKPGQVNYRNVINVNLQNPTMGYLNQMELSTSIKGLTDSKIEYKSSKDMMQMAPSSSFDYPIALNGDRLKAGKYRMTMTAHGQKDPNGQYVVKDSKGAEQKYKYEWKFTKDFEITGSEAKELNDKDVTVKKDSSGLKWLIIAGLVLLAILIFIIIFILWKRRKKDEDDEDEKAARILELEKQLKDKTDE